MKISSAFPSKFLKASDLQGKEVRVEIFDVRLEDVSGEGTEEKAVVYFKDKQKGLVLNITNRNRLVAAFGDETDDWLGKEIFIFSEQTQFGGRPVEGLRIRVPAKEAKWPARSRARCSARRSRSAAIAFGSPR